MEPIGVLCVDPDDAARRATVEGLRSGIESVTVVEARTLADARTALDEGSVDCVITEHELPDGTGLELFEHVRETARDTGCVLYTDADYGAIDTGQFEGVLTEYVGKGSPRALERLAGLVSTTARARVQASYPVPDDEPARTTAAEEYPIDADALQGPLERITTLAAAHVGAPRSTVNLLEGDTQRFLACYGADWTGTAREDSICTFTIVNDRVMTVEDVRDDPRFENNDLLEELGIRSYMGANITTPEGQTVGTLCVYSDRPRSFSEDDERYLTLLADVVVDLVELYRRSPGTEGDDE